MALRMLVIAGPNASGKTRLGVQVAHRLGSEIVSADSRQTYRGLDIGSGKDLDEYREVTPPVPVHLIDVADPREVYSVFHYQRDCYRLLEEKARSRMSQYRLSRDLEVALTIKAWNRFVSGRTMQKLVFNPSSEPFPRIRGIDKEDLFKKIMPVRKKED